MADARKAHFRRSIGYRKCLLDTVGRPESAADAKYRPYLSLEKLLFSV